MNRSESHHSTSLRLRTTRIAPLVTACDPAPNAVERLAVTGAGARAPKSLTCEALGPVIPQTVAVEVATDVWPCAHRSSA